MDMGPDDAIGHLQHERNVWRGIAIGLAAVLVLLLALGAVGGVFLAERNEAVRAEGELRDGLPFIQLAVVDQETFDRYVEVIFGTDRKGLPKGVIEVVL